MAYTVTKLAEDSYAGTADHTFSFTLNDDLPVGTMLVVGFAGNWGIRYIGSVPISPTIAASDDLPGNTWGRVRDGFTADWLYTKIVNTQTATFNLTFDVYAPRSIPSQFGSAVPYAVKVIVYRVDADTRDTSYTGSLGSSSYVGSDIVINADQIDPSATHTDSVILSIVGAGGNSDADLNIPSMSGGFTVLDSVGIAGALAFGVTYSDFAAVFGYKETPHGTAVQMVGQAPHSPGFGTQSTGLWATLVLYWSLGGPLDTTGDGNVHAIDFLYTRIDKHRYVVDDLTDNIQFNVLNEDGTVNRSSTVDSTDCHHPRIFEIGNRVQVLYRKGTQAKRAYSKDRGRTWTVTTLTGITGELVVYEWATAMGGLRYPVAAAYSASAKTWTLWIYKNSSATWQSAGVIATNARKTLARLRQRTSGNWEFMYQDDTSGNRVVKKSKNLSNANGTATFT